MLKKLTDVFLSPHPFHSLVVSLVSALRLGSYEQRAKLGALGNYSHYGYALYHGVKLAKRLGHKRVCVVEFGVAGGNGLLALERHAVDIERELSVGIDIYGFDLGSGLPRPQDFRDLPYYWQPGFYRMDVEKLTSRLTRAKLILGDVRDTMKTFFQQFKPAPVAAVMFDLDIYSGTRDALEVFCGEDRYLLPRIFCYFDDIMGSEECLVSEETGQRAAIKEFNEKSKDRRIDHLHVLESRANTNPKYRRLRIFHNYRHHQYDTFIGPHNQQQPI